MADPHRPTHGQVPPDREPVPGFDPVDPANDPVVNRDPAAHPRNTTTVVNSDRSSSTMIAIVVAAVLVIAAIIAYNWSWSDPQATTMPADPAVVQEPAAPAGETTAPAPEAAAPAAAPADEAPADDTLAPADETVPAE